MKYEKYASILFLCILAFFIIKMVMYSAQKSGVLENSVFVLGKITHARETANGPVISYDYKFDNTTYTNSETMDVNDYGISKKVPMSILVILDRRKPKHSRILLREEDFKEYKVPDSIMIKYYGKILKKSDFKF